MKSKMLDKINYEIEKDEEEVFFNYELAREAIIGIIDILEIKFNKKDFLYQAGIENLRALHESIINILEFYNPPLKIQKMIEEIRCREKSAPD